MKGVRITQKHDFSGFLHETWDSKTFSKKMFWSHQIIPPAAGEPYIDTILYSIYHPQHFCWRHRSSISSRSKILRKWYRDEDAKAYQNMQKHDLLVFLHESSDSKTFSKKNNKWSGAIISSHQLLININKVFNLPFSTFLLKTPKLYLHPISQF